MTSNALRANLSKHMMLNQMADHKASMIMTAFKETIADKVKLYDAYLREIYYLGKHRLTHKYFRIRNGLWVQLFGLATAALLTSLRFF